MTSVAVVLAGCASSDTGPTAGNQLQIQIRAVACSTQTHACVNLSVPNAVIDVTQGSRGTVGHGTTDESGTATIDLAATDGLVHVSITSSAIKSGAQALDVNIDSSLVASVVNFPLAADLQPGP